MSLATKRKTLQELARELEEARACTSPEDVSGRLLEGCCPVRSGSGACECVSSVDKLAKAV